MSIVAFRNATLFDALSGEPRDASSVLVEGDRIVEVGPAATATRTADVTIDCRGRLLMPGLIDAHVHAYFMDLDAQANDRKPITLISHRAQAMLRQTLMRGFTTVRDCGGADHGLWLALEQEWFPGPRLFYCEKLLCQTGGHGDFRNPHDHEVPGFCCGCRTGHISRVIDGEVEARKAVRENLRRGASFIKFAGSGGVSSPTGSVNALQLSDGEVLAIVDEVERAGAYCTAHAHPDAAIRRAVELGVHGIEHASMISQETANLAAARGTRIIPTMAAAAALARYGEEFGYPARSLARLGEVRGYLQDGLSHLKRAGAVVGFGTDVLGPLEQHQGLEFTERGQVYTPAEILMQATSVNAKILGMEGQLGVVAPAAFADLLLWDENPLEDLDLFARQGAPISVIMKGGRFMKHRD